MSGDVFGVEVKYFEGAPELHGRFDDDRDIVYLNGKSETSLDWAFWHEIFHVMKKHEPELYEDILAHVERHEVFTRQQIDDYRQAVKKENRSLADKLAAFKQFKSDSIEWILATEKIQEEVHNTLKK